MAVTGNNGRYVKHTAAADGAGLKKSCLLQSLTWYGFTDAAHTLQVKDGTGNIVVPAFTCDAAATVIGPIHLTLNVRIDGIETDILGSGEVIYHLG